MKKGLITLLIIGGALTLTGSILLGTGIANGAFKDVRTEKRYEITESFSNIDINSFTTSIELKASSDDKCKVECIDKEKLYHEVNVTNDTLTINQVDKYEFYEKMFGYNGNLKVSIYLPQSTYSDLKIELSSGDINLVDNFSFSSVDLKVSSGDINIDGFNVLNSFKIKTSSGKGYYSNMNIKGNTDIEVSSGNINFEHVRCDSTSISSSSGKVIFNDYISTGHLSVKTSSGRVEFINSDANTLNIKTSSGSVKGNLLTPKTFKVQTSSGKIDVPSTTGPLCEINVSSGSVILKVGEVSSN